MLFRSGVDLPGIDTIMLLRPTESKILFLQQIGRGLRTAPDKDHLVILDFIGNHQSFLHKPQALFNVAANYKALAQFARQVQQNSLTLPAGCFVNYDLQLIDFLKQLDSGGAQKEYEALRGTLGRRPTLAEFYRSGAAVSQPRQQYGCWFSFVDAMGDLGHEEQGAAARHMKFFRDVETTAMTKSFKMVLLDALLEHDGFTAPPTLAELAAQSKAIIQRRRRLIQDISQPLQNIDAVDPAAWQRYWDSNPVNAWVGGNRPANQDVYFQVADGRFTPRFTVAPAELEIFTALLQELIDYRFASYEARNKIGRASWRERV